MSEYLQPGRYIDSGNASVVDFSRSKAKGASQRERAVSLYYAVRDEIRYNPFLDFSKPEVFTASSVLAAGEGFCIGKAALLAAVARAARIEARVGFADVPVQEIQAAFREAYPRFFQLGEDAAKETFAPG